MTRFILSLLLLAPTLAQAQIDQSSSFKDLIGYFIELIALVLPVVAGLALFVFFKGLVAFIAKSGDAKSHADGKNLMIYGILALFVMMSVYGILFFFHNDFFDRPFGVPLLPDDIRSGSTSGGGNGGNPPTGGGNPFTSGGNR